jgi:hypothetical protein
MWRYLLVRVLGKLIARPIRWRINAFDAATQDPKAVQEALLRRILTAQAGTAFGRDHGFGSVRSVADFRRQVPVAPYERVEPYIARERKGERGALLADPRVLMFALTSGTTAARKFIPVTPQYLADFRRTWNIWGLKLYRAHRPVILRPIVQLAGDPDEFRTECGIPCGSLTGLTARVQKRLVRRLYCVPACTGRIKDADARHYAALRFSLPRQVGMILSANPSTLVGLARAADRHKERLIRDIRDGTLNADLDVPAPIRKELARRLKRRPERARELEAVANRTGSLRPADVWPLDRCVIGTWTGGSVGPYLRQLPAYYGTMPVRDLGLLASEGRMTLPVEDGTPSGVLDITSHYFEFIPEDELDSPQPTVLAAHELAEGRSYYILPTTAFGLYRYQIFDLVRVTGFYNKTPLLEFLGKGNRFANLTGEKLSEHHVTQAMDAAAAQVPAPLGAGYSLAPCWDDAQPFYGLFVEDGDWAEGELPQRLLTLLDHHLGERNVEYAAKRDSARLGPPRLMLLPPGTWQKWDRERLAATGGPADQYKHPCLIGDLDFRAAVPVERELTLPHAAAVRN